MSLKPVLLESDGIFGQLPNGGIINAGGTSHPTFTVDGRGLLFDDGSSTGSGGGGSYNNVTLQLAYNNSPNVGGVAGIQLAPGKDFVIQDSVASSHYFRINALTGKVTITGDLEVLGGSAIIDTVIQDSDHWLISPRLGNTTALKIEPDVGVVPIVDLVNIRRTYGSAPVFRIDQNGNLIATQNLTVMGLINGVNIAQLKADVDHHAAGDPGYRHMATDVDIIPIPTLPTAHNVQEALQALDVKITTGVGSGGVFGYEHVQVIPDNIWNVQHNGNTRRVQVTIYDTNWEQLIPDIVRIVDANTIHVTFRATVDGRAILVLF
jgi:hypothetical protein